MIHSPTIDAAKFSPGELGVYSNFAVVCARLIIDEQDCGIQFFMVPIRHPETHRPFHGVEVGDIGAKIGYNSKDNGYLMFTNYRIPRENLLMKYCKVDKEGKLSLDGDPRLLYAVMLGMRMWIISFDWRFLAHASVIAGRYSVVRRQFANLPGEKRKERKLLDYQAHQIKLIGALAMSITQNLAQNYLAEYYYNFIQDLYAGSENYEPLKIIHHFSAGLKAHYTWGVHSSLQTLRESCGGAGYHQFSGLPYLYTEHAACVAFEGDNTVMIQQCAKIIIDGVSKEK